jgi:RNA polymerase sigma-70 factor (sigma-E family)
MAGGGRSTVDDPDGFREFVHAHSPQLLRTAWLITRDWHDAEDLVQTALAKTLPRWEKLTRHDNPQLYIRKVMVNTFLSWRRRRSSTEMVLEKLPDSPTADQFDGSDLHALVLTAVRNLPPRRRAIVALRFFDDLTYADTATALGCHIGTVKSQTARALRQLRTDPDLTTLGAGG